MDGESKSNVAEFSVSEISNALKRTVEEVYGHVRVRGEISGYRGPHSSGHAYFALKDDHVAGILENLAGLAAEKGHLRTRTGPRDRDSLSSISATRTIAPAIAR